jgi:hypothetical protein
VNAETSVALSTAPFVEALGRLIVAADGAPARVACGETRGGRHGDPRSISGSNCASA